MEDRMKRVMALLAAILIVVGLAASGATPAQAGNPAGWSASDLKAGEFLVTTPDGQVGPASVAKANPVSSKDYPKAYDKNKAHKGIWDGKSTSNIPSKSLTTCPASLCYFYGGGHQGYTSAGSSAGQGSAFIQANLTNHSPAVCSGDSYHSLAEIAMTTGAPGSRNIVEVGWNVDPTVNGGSLLPYLFVHNWVKESAKGYNGVLGGQGTFVDYGPNLLNAGMPLPAGDIGLSKPYALQYFSNAWWVQYDGNWVGYYPDSDWTSNVPTQVFTNATGNLGQGFGELASVNTTPKSDMGNALLGTDLNSARVGSWNMLDSTLAAYTPNLSPFQQSGQTAPATSYTAAFRTGSVRTGGYGGPGWNATGTGPGVVGC